MRKVCGVGVNDADYQVSAYINGGKVFCPIYNIWKGMMRRCYSNEGKFSAYSDCSVDDRWHSFMSFKVWVDKQDWKGKHLDKDLLIKGNRKYGPDTCIFITPRINSFMAIRPKIKNHSLPIGVELTRSGSYKASCSNGDKSIKLGNYATPMQAHKAYLEFKSKLANQLADSETDTRVAEALRMRYNEMSPFCTKTSANDIDTIAC